MNIALKSILAACSLVFIVCGSILGLEYLACIATLKVGLRLGLKIAAGSTFVLGVVLVGGDFVYSLWQASKN